MLLSRWNLVGCTHNAILLLLLLLAKCTLSTLRYRLHYILDLRGFQQVYDDTFSHRGIISYIVTYPTQLDKISSIIIK